MAGVLLLYSGAAAWAQTTFTWTGLSGGNNNWMTSSNWSAGVPASATTTDLIFGGNNRLAPNMNANWTAKSVTFASGAGAFTLGSSGGFTLTLDAGGVTNNSTSLESISNAIALNASQTWTAASGGLAVSGAVNLGFNNLTIAGAKDTALTGTLSGGSSGNTLTKNGSGTLTISGNNSFGQVLALNAGNVVLTNSNALGPSTYGNTIAAGAALHLQNNITVSEGSFSVAGTGPGGAGAIVNDSGANTLNAQLNLAGNTTINTVAGSLTQSGQISLGSNALTLTGAGAATINSQVTGTGDLIKAGAGTAVFQQTINNTGVVNLGGSGAVTLQQALGGAASLTVSNSATTTFNGTVNTNGDINLNGPGNVVFAQAVGAANGGGLNILSSGSTSFGGAVSVNNIVTVGGSGAVSFGGDLNTNNHAVNVSNSQPTTFTGNINAGTGLVSVGGAGNVNFNGGQVNSSGLTIAGSGAVSAASTLNLGGGNLTVSGSGTSTFSGPQVNVGGIAVTGSGTQAFNTQINANSLTLSGSGTTTLAGTGDNNIATTSITGGTLLLNKTSGTALTGNVTVAGGTLDFGANNQTTAWTNLTLGAGSTLLLNNTTQSLSNLTITGNTVIDFAGGGSSLTVGNLSLANNATLSIINWSNASDYFSANVDPGSPVLGNIVINGTPGATWNPGAGGSITPASPVPEPMTYGVWLLGAGLVYFGVRRWRNDRRAMRGAITPAITAGLRVR